MREFNIEDGMDNKLVVWFAKGGGRLPVGLEEKGRSDMGNFGSWSFN